jgi:anti-sigma factor RsiW
MKAPERIDLLLLVHAYCDGELDPVTARAIERQIALRPELAAERARIEAVRDMLHGQRAGRAAPVRKSRRLDRALGFVRGQWPRMRQAGAMAACAALSCGLTWLVATRSAPDSLLQELAANHTRALLASRITDVPSSDRHMVKPWLSARSAIAPRVVDLTTDGFPLLGGRLDIIHRIPVATLVYGERKHILSLTALPQMAAQSTPRGLSKIDGLNAFGWSAGDVAYWVISDVDSADLEDFANRFRQH